MKYGVSVPNPQESIIYHPVYGKIGHVIDYLKGDQLYLIFEERSVSNLTEGKHDLRALPLRYLYADTLTKELRVDFSPEWIKSAPMFTASELAERKETLLQAIDNYYAEHSGFNQVA